MYQIPELLKFPNLYHAFSTKDEGNMANAILGKTLNFKNILENRKKFLKKIQISVNKCICMWVLGGNGVHIANEKEAGISMVNYNKAVKTDAIITNEKGLFLMLLVADCAPIIVYDPIKSVMALVHVGWKGADLEIVKRVINSLKNKYRSRANDLIVGIGPAARKGSFIKENPSQKNDPRWKQFIEKVTPKLFWGGQTDSLDGEKKEFYKVDFVGLCKKQLIEIGVLEENIFDSKIDTAKDRRFFSHVREGNLSLEKQGRFACVAGIM